MSIFMRAFLTGANRISGSARTQATAAMKRKAAGYRNVQMPALLGHTILRKLYKIPAGRIQPSQQM